MLTWQDFLAGQDDIPAFIMRLIGEHESGELVKTAKIADLYDRQKNVTINEYIQKIYTHSGLSVENYIASNNRIASNFFRRLNVQRNMYSLGNGVTFKDGNVAERLDKDLDVKLKNAGYKALIHGVAFTFLNVDHIHVFPVTEFVPLLDENTGRLMAGVRYWQIDASKPMTAVLYTPDGYATYRTGAKDKKLELVEEMRAYKQTVQKAPADHEAVVVQADNYGGALPIVPLWGSNLHQSTLVGMRQAIDSHDLVRSGFANDLQDCAQIYWLLENYGGMRPEDVQEFVDRMRLQHVAMADTVQDGKITPYTQDVPHEARTAYLAQIRAGIYEDFGGLDVTAISAANQTATAIEAAYQPLDENADDFEYQIIECVRALLALIGVDDTPTFKRNRISNQLEQVQMAIMEAEYLDDRTLLEQFPNIDKDKIDEILARRDTAAQSRFARETEPDDGLEDIGGGDA